jgi:EpsI family protein
MTTRRALIASAVACAASVATAEVLKPRRLLVDRIGEARLAAWIPAVCGAWRQDDSMLTGSVVTGGLVDTLYQQVVSRFYRHEDGRVVMLSVAYGRVQSDSLQLHTPDACYPAQGFAFSDQGRNAVLLSAGELPVHRAIATLGVRVEPMTWWALVGDQVANDGSARKLAQITYLLHGEIPDGLICRVSSIGTNTALEWDSHDQFVRALSLALDGVTKLRFLGAYG